MKTRALTAAATGANSATFRSNGKPVTLALTGTMGGSTVSVQPLADDTGPTFAVGEHSLSAVGSKTFTFPKGTDFRLTVTGGAGVSLDAWLHFA